MALLDKQSKRLVSYGLHYPEKACLLGMTIIAVTLVLHMLGVIPEWKKAPSIPNLVPAAVAAEKGH